MENPEIRIDPLTGESFIPKKITQIFASSANRIKFNNNKASKLRKERAYVDKPLCKNHMILRNLLSDKKEFTESRDFFRGKEFSFVNFTDYREHGGEKYPCVYEFMIIAKGDQILIRKL
ncbi:MAG TPA: hypothetical protein VGB50_06245 [Flavobacterium sp.]|jgi:hypothetical protein